MCLKKATHPSLFPVIPLLFLSSRFFSCHPGVGRDPVPNIPYLDFYWDDGRPVLRHPLTLLSFNYSHYP